MVAGRQAGSRHRGKGRLIEATEMPHLPGGGGMLGAKAVGKKRGILGRKKNEEKEKKIMCHKKVLGLARDF